MGGRIEGAKLKDEKKELMARYLLRPDWPPKSSSLFPELDLLFSKSQEEWTATHWKYWAYVLEYEGHILADEILNLRTRLPVKRKRGRPTKYFRFGLLSHSDFERVQVEKSRRPRGRPEKRYYGCKISELVEVFDELRNEPINPTQSVGTTALLKSFVVALRTAENRRIGSNKSLPLDFASLQRAMRRYRQRTQLNNKSP